VRNYTCAQIFTTSFEWSHVRLMEYEQQVPLAFKSIFKDVGVSSKLVMEGARVQVRGEIMEQYKLARCDIVELERGTTWANHAERMIGQLKAYTKRGMDR